MEPLDQQANYLLCVATGPEKSLGLAWADISTSDFYVRTYRDVGEINSSRGFYSKKYGIFNCERHTHNRFDMQDTLTIILDLQSLLSDQLHSDLLFIAITL